MNISKLDAAKRELEFAIRLFFTGGDPVVLHLIASSTNQILEDLCTHKGIVHLRKDMEQDVRPEMKSEFRKIFKKAYNFFKHADEDPGALLEFNSESTTFIIWGAVKEYQSLTQEVTGIMMAFRAWFFAKNTEMLTKPEEVEAYKKIAQDFNVDNKLQYLDVGNEFEEMRLGTRKGMT